MRSRRQADAIRRGSRLAKEGAPRRLEHDDAGERHAEHEEDKEEEARRAVPDDGGSAARVAAAGRLPRLACGALVLPLERRAPDLVEQRAAAEIAARVADVERR